jgi:chemotaxis protein MotB
MSQEDEDIEVAAAEEESELWLVSYADLMTLIACFFILMVAFANFDPKTFARKSREVSKSITKQDLDSDLMDDISTLKQEIEADPEFTAKVEAKINDKGLMLTFSSNALFDSGSADLKEDSKIMLESLVEVIKKKNEKFRIIVEGHTDDAPIIAGAKIKSNWNLSSLRASEVIYMFEQKSFNPKQLVSVGYADTRPIAPNKNDKGEKILENMAQNRRVVIKVIEPSSQIERKKMGLGIYFNEVDQEI